MNTTFVFIASFIVQYQREECGIFSRHHYIPYHTSEIN